MNITPCMKYFYQLTVIAKSNIVINVRYKVGEVGQGRGAICYSNPSYSLIVMLTNPKGGNAIWTSGEFETNTKRNGQQAINHFAQNCYALSNLLLRQTLKWNLTY